MRENVTPGETPEKITVSMIHEDLNNGITKPEMAIKYGIKSWEVAEMFKHPFLKGRRPSKKKPLSFTFIDDVSMTPDGEETVVDPNQVTLEQAIEESTKEIETAVNGLADINKSIVDMLGPTDPEETVESLINEVKAAAEEEEDLEVEDDTFEL